MVVGIGVGVVVAAAAAAEVVVVVVVVVVAAAVAGGDVDTPTPMLLAFKRFSRSMTFCMTVSSCRSCLVSTLRMRSSTEACCLARLSSVAVMLSMCSSRAFTASVTISLVFSMAELTRFTSLDTWQPEGHRPVPAVVAVADAVACPPPEEALCPGILLPVAPPPLPVAPPPPVLLPVRFSRCCTLLIWEARPETRVLRSETLC